MTAKGGNNRGWWQKTPRRSIIVGVTYDEVIEARGSFPTLAGRLDSMGGDVDDLKVAVAALEVEVSAGRGGFDSLDLRFDASELAITDLQTDVIDLEVAVSDIEVEISDARGGFFTLDMRFDAIELALSDVQVEVSNARSGYPSLDARIDAIAVNTSFSSLTLNNGIADGGNLILQSAGFTSWDIDNSSGVLRFSRAGSVWVNVNASGNMTLANDMIFDNGAVNGAGIEFRSQGNTAWVLDNDSGSVRFQRSGVTCFDINASGVAGVRDFQLENFAASGGKIEFKSSGFTSWFLNNQSGVIRFVRGGNSYLEINASGKTTVGLGLDISGSLSVFRDGSFRDGGIVVMFANPVSVLGTASRGTGTTTLTVTSHSIPAGCRGVLVRIYSKITSGTPADGTGAHVRRQGGSDSAVEAYPQVTNIYMRGFGICPINTANDQIDFVIAGATQTGGLQFYGYVT